MNNLAVITAVVISGYAVIIGIEAYSTYKLRRLERRMRRRQVLSRRREERDAQRFRSEYLKICNEFAEECQKEVPPLRKAVGFFSDEAAQVFVKYDL